MPIVTFAREGITIDVPTGTSLREAAERCGVRLYTGLFRVINCYGHGLCGECRVVVMDGAENLTHPTEREKTFTRPSRERHLGKCGIYETEGERLPCQADISGPVTVWTRLRAGRPPADRDPARRARKV